MNFTDLQRFVFQFGELGTWLSPPVATGLLRPITRSKKTSTESLQHLTGGFYLCEGGPSHSKSWQKPNWYIFYLFVSRHEVHCSNRHSLHNL